MLSPDPWMIALFGESDAGGKRDILEGRLVAIGLETLRRGADPAPASFADWSAWASWRWPTLPRFP